MSIWLCRPQEEKVPVLTEREPAFRAAAHPLLPPAYTINIATLACIHSGRLDHCTLVAMALPHLFSSGKLQLFLLTSLLQVLGYNIIVLSALLLTKCGALPCG